MILRHSLLTFAERPSRYAHYAGLSWNHEAKPGPHVFLQVIDTGTGISPAVIDKIFDPSSPRRNSLPARAKKSPQFGVREADLLKLLDGKTPETLSISKRIGTEEGPWGCETRHEKKALRPQRA